MCAKGEYTEASGTMALFSTLVVKEVTLLCRFFAGLKGARIGDEEARVVEKLRMHIVKYVLEYIVKKKGRERETLDLLKCLLENVRDWSDSGAKTKVWQVVLPLVRTAKEEERVEDLVEFLELASLIIRGVESLEVELDGVEHVRNICDEILEGRKEEEEEEEEGSELEGQARLFVTAIVLKELEEKRQRLEEQRLIETMVTK